MSEMQNPKSTKNVPPPPSSSSSNDTPLKVEKSPKIHYPNPPETPTPKISYPNPPETSIPEPTTLREQWRFAIRQYSKWYSHAWGTAILAGGAFFALVDDHDVNSNVKRCELCFQRQKLQEGQNGDLCKSSAASSDFVLMKLMRLDNGCCKSCLLSTCYIQG
ncbi:hypothetical protein MRB53_009575 [Persea americana]|uniref:Uncharacterized protein n=1 Tax=Persea americana TaxID=3435 RepID=A0ACC2LQ72_PERAE|nr:hypothetical protein MRB53_009575 [Persea americana]